MHQVPNGREEQNQNADLSNIMGASGARRINFADDTLNTNYQRTGPGLGVGGSKRPQTSLAHGAKKRVNTDAEPGAEVLDRVQDLEQENFNLKQKENVLEKELKK